MLANYLLTFVCLRQLRFTLLIFPSMLFAQTATAPPFQQEVNYRIVATLDDTRHTLTGEVEFEYINNSPDVLTEMWVHLWGNAFQDCKSAFCKQKLRDQDGKYYFSKKSERGSYDKLHFMADGQKTAWKFDPKHPDIAILSLPKPLVAGGRTKISTPFVLKIPASFSRLGHVETSYQMTQWYPKPAVYDRKGWHPMPYLDIGEFYAEFGSFDVTLTLPENYVVGATGLLQTPSEIEFLQQKEAESRAYLFGKTSSENNPYHALHSFPPSSSKLKTIRYTAELVHDFAWFADKRFLVLKDTAQLASGRSVDCWAMFPPSKKSIKANTQSELWKKGAFYVRRAVEFYSKSLGEYPYPQATAVHSALSAGGGMEYPMVTVIGNSGSASSLDEVITHEVGHNWFYGILASNERLHPFMDEGLNTYYESRYMREYYGEFNPVDLPKFILDPEKQGSLLENGYLILARDRKDTPPDTHSDRFTPAAYGLQVYMKTGLCLAWLEQAVGREKLDAAMQAYYRRWQFNHPYPEDLRAVLEEMGLEVDWLFKSLQTREQADYRLKKVRRSSKADTWTLSVQNKGTLQAPFPVTALKDGKPMETRWFSPKQESKTQTIEFQSDSVDAFEIDWYRHTLDLNRKNNFRRTTGPLAGMRPVEFRAIAPLQNARRNTLAVLPWAGWNNYDKAMLGLVFYNSPLPSRRFQYYLLPGYASASKSIVGLVDLRYKFYPGGLIPKVTIGASAKTFHFRDIYTRNRQFSRFYRVAPEIRAELKHNSLSFRHALVFTTYFVGNQVLVLDSADVSLGTAWRNNTVHELRYEAEQRALPHPFRFRAALEAQQFQGSPYLRSSAEWRQQFYYREKKKLSARVFAGYFLQNPRRNETFSAPNAAFSLNPQGFNDYRFDQTYLARSGAEGLLGRQLAQTDGGFKGAFGPNAANLGSSNNFVLALNLKADLPKLLPVSLPIKPYLDLGYFDNPAYRGNEQFLWSGGLMLEFFNGGLELYFPLAHSKNLRDQYRSQADGKYLNTITWSMRLRFGDPLEMVENALR